MLTESFGQKTNFIFQTQGNEPSENQSSKLLARGDNQCWAVLDFYEEDPVLVQKQIIAPSCFNSSLHGHDPLLELQHFSWSSSSPLPSSSSSLNSSALRQAICPPPPKLCSSSSLNSGSLPDLVPQVMIIFFIELHLLVQSLLILSLLGRVHLLC